MADLNVTEMDPAGGAMTETTQTAAATDDLSATTPAPESQTAPQGFDEDFLKKLDALDPTSLPQSFAEKFVPKSEFTKKTQALAEDRKRFETERSAMFEMARKVIEQRSAGPAGPSPEDTRLQELSELAATGDPKAQMQMADLLAERKIAPIRTQITLQNAAQNARSNPLAGDAVTEHWNDIVQTMQNDPVIAGLATANNFAAADRVMVALGLEHKVRTMLPQMETYRKENEALKAKLATYEKERTAGLPSSTTRAGTTAGRPAPSEPTDINDIALKAWLESGGTQNDFR
jgi:hypothetical protein